MAQNESVDVVLVGAGIMSATLAVLLKELDPTLKLEVVEAMDSGAAESSNPWNNAGTGHAGLCELNYTPQAADGSIDIKKAVHINTQFEVSRQFWAYLSKKGNFGSARAFINPVPHLSYVEGDKGVSFLKKRYELLKQHHAFADMEYTEDKAVMKDWMPLMMPGRPADQHIAATRVLKGTDVNFGALTNKLLKLLGDSQDAQVKYSKKVVGLRRNGKGWTVSIKDVNSGGSREVDARFVFLGAGGAALPLLQLSGIPESKVYGGFPVGGEFLVTENPAITERHLAKVYGLADTGSPPMSVPHLDTRVLDGKRVLLFGPFATWSSKFLKNGSYFDLAKATTFANVIPQLQVGVNEFALVKYLAQQLSLNKEQKMDALRHYMPEAKDADWRLWEAGQRVQIIKNDPEKGGILKLGTEVVVAQDRSLTALLGASPGGSTSPAIMLTLLEKAFPEKVKSAEWQEKIRKIVPSYGVKLNENPALLQQEWQATEQALNLAIASPSLQGVEAGVQPNENMKDLKKVPDMAL